MSTVSRNFWRTPVCQRTILAAAAAVTTAVLCFCGCSRRATEDSPGAKTVTVFTMQLKPMFTSYMEGIFAEFERRNPGVKVKWVDQPAQDYETKLLSLILNEQAPDVINLSYEHLVHMHERGLLTKLDGLAPPEARGRFIKAVVDKGCSVGGEWCAVPWYLASTVTMVNRDLMREAGLDPDKPPRNNDELFAMSLQIKEKTGKFGFLMNFSEDGQLKVVLAAEGIPLVDASGKKAVFDTPEAARLLGEYKKLFDAGAIPRESVTAEHRSMIEYYKAGRTAFMLTGPQFIRFVREEAPGIYKATGIAPAFPVKPSGDFVVDIQALAVFARSKHPKEAVDLALFIASAENQLDLAEIVTVFPSDKAALEKLASAKAEGPLEEQARKVVIPQIEKATIIIPDLPRLSELNRVMSDIVQQVLLKDVPTEKALADGARRWTEILNK